MFSFGTLYNSSALRRLWWALRIATAIFFCFLLWEEWSSEGKANWEGIFQRTPHWGLVFAAFVLAFVNWGLEARKWQWLVSVVVPLSFAKAIRGTLAGLIPGFFTPNRIGEFGGRMLVIPPTLRARALIPTIAGSFSQLLVTLVMGALACWLVAGKAGILQGNWYWAIGFMAALLSFALCLLYFHLPVLWPLLQKAIPIPTSNFPKHSALIRAVEYSFLRYLVFTIQYILILSAFNIYIPLLWSMPAVFCLFFIQTAVPSVSLLELGLRGKSTLVVIGLFSQDTQGMVLSAFLLWMINLVIPALLGLPSLFHNNLHES